MTALPRLAVLVLLLAAPLRAADDRVEPLFPAGEWDLVSIRIGPAGPGGLDAPPNFRFHFGRGEVRVFEGDSPKPKDVSPLKIKRLTGGSSDGVLEIAENGKKQLFLYRFRAGRLELCTRFDRQDTLPNSFTGDGAIVIAFVPTRQGRIVSASHGPPQKQAPEVRVAPNVPAKAEK
jgi:hypothetical protein